MRRITLIFRALCELGFRQLGFYFLYHLGLRSGYYRWAEKRMIMAAQKMEYPCDDDLEAIVSRFIELLPLPSRAELFAVLDEPARSQLQSEADAIVAGQVRLFGRKETTPLRLTPPNPVFHWIAYARGNILQGKNVECEGDEPDVKLLWEPARFGWAYTLARAYYLSGDEKYCEAFWTYVKLFITKNPAYYGIHWASAQEVAIRLMALVFCLRIFSASKHSTPQRVRWLIRSLMEHAQRIPVTLLYSRAQNNNHLLSEAAGLLTAGVVLADHPSAKRWRRMGWHFFNQGLESQIFQDGCYVQHSTNYHRLMLQLALWVYYLIKDRPFSEKSWKRLRDATYWLMKLTDSQSGRVPNLGPNDGAYIFPLTICPFEDYRPVLQAAGASFLNQKPFPTGVWDEIGVWLGCFNQSEKQPSSTSHQATVPAPGPSTVIHTVGFSSWAYLRIAQFSSRPGHADQLHFDLWWRGLNVAKDAGTYSYNSPPPWDNALARTEVHNTVVVNGQDQMRRAGRFLYLNWAQGQVVTLTSSQDGTGSPLVVAEHNGYRRKGIIHRRSVDLKGNNTWIIEDRLLSVHPSPTIPNNISASLHWLLADWPFEARFEGEGLKISVDSPLGEISLFVILERLSEASLHAPEYQIVRAGEVIFGSQPAAPILGWSSPTYGVKIPSLSVRLNAVGSIPLAFKSVWTFPASEA